MDVVLGMPFLSLINANIKFAKLRTFTKSQYTTVETLSTTSRVKLIDKMEFVKTALDENFKIFIVYIATPDVMTIYPSQAAQIAAL